MWHVHFTGFSEVYLQYNTRPEQLNMEVLLGKDNSCWFTITFQWKNVLPDIILPMVTFDYWSQNSKSTYYYYTTVTLQLYIQYIYNPVKC